MRIQASRNCLQQRIIWRHLLNSSLKQRGTFQNHCADVFITQVLELLR